MHLAPASTLRKDDQWNTRSAHLSDHAKYEDEQESDEYSDTEPVDQARALGMCVYMHAVHTVIRMRHRISTDRDGVEWLGSHAHTAQHQGGAFGRINRAMG